MSAVQLPLRAQREQVASGFGKIAAYDTRFITSDEADSLDGVPLASSAMTHRGTTCLLEPERVYRFGNLNINTFLPCDIM